MNNELLIAKGRLADLKQQYEDLERRADALLIQIRELLNPTMNFLDFDLDLVFSLVKEFRSLQLQARDIYKKIIQIQETYNL